MAFRVELFFTMAVFFTLALLTNRDDSFERVAGLNMSAREMPMRDFIFMLAPVALIIYFVVYPDQFNALLGWAGQYVH